MSGSEASWSSSSSDVKDTPTPIEIVFADKEDRETLLRLRRFLATRLMNVWRYESLVEALGVRPLLRGTVDRLLIAS